MVECLGDVAGLGVTELLGVLCMTGDACPDFNAIIAWPDRSGLTGMLLGH